MPDDPWAQFRVNTPSAAPSQAPPQRFPGVIPGAPKQPSPQTPDQAEQDRLNVIKANQAIQEKQQELDAGQQAKAIEAERKAAAFLIRALGSNEDYEKTGVGPRSYVGQKMFDNAPDVLNTLPSAVGNSDERQVSDSAQNEFIAATLRQDSGAAIPPEELEKQRRIYFPMPGDSEDAVAQKRKARIRAIEGLKQSSGRLEASAEERYNALVGENSQGDQKPWTMDDTIAKWGDALYDDNGNPLGPDGGGAYDKVGNYLGLFGEVTGQGTSEYTNKVNAKAAQYDKTMGDPSLLQQGLMMGFGDEASGVGEAISGLLHGDTNVANNYSIGRDAERQRLDRARNEQGGMGTAAEFIGGMASGGSGLVNAAMSPAKLAGQGALVGGVSGFGAGEGVQGSTTNALLGAGAGAALGFGGGKVGERMAARSATKSAQTAKVQNLADAGTAEGVTVNRAMADPALQNRVTGVDSSLVGGPRIQRGMNQIEGQIGNRVQDLGRGGTPLNPEEAGNMGRAASERFIDKTGASAKRKYDRAEKIAGNAKIEPKQSLAAVDQMITQLSETPETNKAEIAYLQTLKSDLSNDLSVGGLRRMRTKLRKTISKGDLVFGEDEARVLEIMNTAGDDIRAGLTAQGKPEAARAFDTADKAYRARMDYINGTIQKVIGKRGVNKSAEDVFRSFSNMARGKDAAGLRKFYATLAPDEAADVAATFADELGRNTKGEFSVAHFLTQSRKLSDSAIETIFGKDGAQSLKNLRLLGTETNRVTSAMNSRKSGTSVGNDYRSWLFNVLLAASPGAYSGSVGTAVGGAAAAGGIKATRDILSARSLLSPKLTKWISTAPNTTSPAAINNHFARLGEIARLEPALAPEIDALRSAIMQTANDNAGRMGSAAASPDQGPQQQQ